MAVNKQFVKDIMFFEIELAFYNIPLHVSWPIKSELIVMGHDCVYIMWKHKVLGSNDRYLEVKKDI